MERISEISVFGMHRKYTRCYLNYYPTGTCEEYVGSEVPKSARACRYYLVTG